MSRAAFGERMRQSLAIAREAAASARSQKVASVLTMAVVAALCSTVLLTAGRTEGSATAVLSSLDASGTRSIIVRAQPGAGLDTGVLDRLRPLRDVAWLAAFGPAEDVTNAAIPGGQPVALRRAYGLDLRAAAGAPDARGDASALSADRLAAGGPGGAASGAPDARAFASASAARQLGLAEGVGVVASTGSASAWNVAGRVDLPPDLQFLDPIVIAPAAFPSESAVRGATGDDGAQPVAVLVVRASSPAQVGAVAAAVTSVLGADDPTKVTVQTSEQLAAVRQQVEGQLGDFGRGLVLSTFGASAALVAAILYALVMLRRRDFGRRRALGASRSLVVALLLAQVALLAVAGAVIGMVAGLGVLAASHSPLPSAAFATAVAVLAVLTSTVAAVAPALVASTRDPLRELRVP